ncbi:helix-turn-helix domain-containing protein [Secundilactobacillus collinoides]|uniref:XRE family transcriptional regulator n=1 Tax=Secundilactobacillus collinoides TaxID=33960 RepID=A0A166GDV5_SECCO|nr:helix-turn-helix transcriptional regulator [Secundilactobacillus collinoides]KZL38747.1 hypothetical protein TY91_11890 [Secundilactobacillus collinoides]
MDNKTLGKFIHRMRINNGMTMTEFISLIDDTQRSKGSGSTVIYWESGKSKPSIKRLKKLLI